MPTAVDWTNRAEQQYEALSNRQQTQVAQFLRQLEAEGCAALGYRLTGELPIDHICVKHLGGMLRVVVAFRSSGEACVILIGPHADHDPGMDVYTALYALAEISPPKGERTKPPCCGSDGEPPILAAAVDELADRAIKVRRTRR